MMAERKIIGVDFSGSKDEGKTWVAQGHLTTDGACIIDRVHPITRQDLYALVANASAGTVIALDFPFALPSVFLRESLEIHARRMGQVWQEIANTNPDTFRAKCHSFGRHPKRVGDKAIDCLWRRYDNRSYGITISALNRRLVPMTFRGIEMLNALVNEYPLRWCILPRDCPGNPTDAKSNRTLSKITILEVMPGALLWAVGFDYKTVKGYKETATALPTRDHIINNLSEFANVKLPNLCEYRLALRANDDCMDAVIAAVGAAAWASGVPFRFPEPHELQAAQLEGWPYAPNPAKS